VRRLRRHRHDVAVAIGLLAFGPLVGAGLAATSAFADGAHRAGPTQTAATAPTVTSPLPRWLAPGARLTVSGFAGATAPVVLRADGAPVARATSGPLGRYRLSFRPQRPGRVRLTVQSGGLRRSVGVLLVRSLTLQAVGDITFGEQVSPAIADYGAAYPWQHIARTLRDADITIGNLETSVSTRGVAAVKEYTFRGAPRAVPPLATLAGFDVLTLANNHAVDYGRDALLDTIRTVHGAGIATVGAGADDTAAHRPAIVEAGGLKVGFLGYSDINPAGFVAAGGTPGTAAADSARIAADVHALLRRVDVAVCFFHWGVEMRPEPDGRQQQFAAACLNAGAAVVLGAHPHVLGRVSRPTAHGLVAWTLGNFMFPSSGATARTAILRVLLDTHGVRGYRLLPVVIDGFRPRLASTG
jgi:poly-gamma-glutamate capsule biosynthesis protein CapA/YwtB (metallophosphatase superfamily)